jgi:hypothetical protein
MMPGFSSFKKEGSLFVWFCFVLMRFTKLRMLQIVFLMSLESSQ